MEKPDALIQQILADLKSRAPVKDTPQLNGILLEIATKNHLDQWDKCGKGEWMGVDICWWQYEPRERLILAGESEIYRDNLEATSEDFEKLASLKSDIKLVIMWADIQVRDNLFRRLLDYLKKFSQHSAGEHYLLITLNPRNNPRHGEIGGTCRFAVGANGAVGEFVCEPSDPQWQPA